MDFFSNVTGTDAGPLTSDVSGFAAALNNRSFSFQLSQSPTLRRKPDPPLAAEPPSEFLSLTPPLLSSLLSSSTNVLVIDIRPHYHWLVSRIKTSLNLNVPSTLLRRPAFSLEQLATMLPVQTDQYRFLHWQSTTHVVVYDADTSSVDPSTLVKGNNILSLLAKFKAAGYGGTLAYLHGGINAVRGEEVDDLVEDDVLDGVLSDGDQAVSNGSAFLSARHLPSVAFQQASTTVHSQRLPQFASHQGAIKTPHLSELSAAGVHADNQISPTMSRQSNHPANAPLSSKTSAANPFYDNIRQHAELSSGITERIPLYLPRRVLRRKHELPFQWLRDIVKWGGGYSPDELEVALAKQPPDAILSGHEQVSRRSRDYAAKRMLQTEHKGEGMEALAMQFYRIELGEQRRMMGVMGHHTGESAYPIKASTESQQEKALPSPSNLRKTGAVQPRHVHINHSHTPQSAAQLAASSVPISSSIVVESLSSHVPQPEGEVATMNTEELQEAENAPYFPFSITAGIEKGAKNRYRNIWPFDHARVRLQSASEDDYVNASYIQPRGTNRRYIATQGPLSSTYTDFWMLCWEQNVRVLVMLTKRVENNLAKCGSYWAPGSYGPLRLSLVKEEGAVDADGGADDPDASTGGFDFSTHFANSAKAAKRALRAKRAMKRELGNQSHDDSTPEDDNTSSDDDDAIIRRTFLLSNTLRPDLPPRSIVQLQYVGWPDVNIPESPKNILRLVWELDGLVEHYEVTGSAVGISSTPAIAKSAERVKMDLKDRQPAPLVHAKTQPISPILVHCSAGVGRTGSFIVIDALLNALKREMVIKVRKEAQKHGLSQPVVPTSGSTSSRAALSTQPPDTGSTTSDNTLFTRFSIDRRTTSSLSSGFGPTLSNGVSHRDRVGLPDKPMPPVAEGVQSQFSPENQPNHSVFGMADQSTASLVSNASAVSLPPLGALSMGSNNSPASSRPALSRPTSNLKSPALPIITPPPFPPASSSVRDASAASDMFSPLPQSTQADPLASQSAHRSFDLPMDPSMIDTTYTLPVLTDAGSLDYAAYPVHSKNRNRKFPRTSNEAFDFMTPRQIRIPRHSRPDHPHVYPGVLHRPGTKADNDQDDSLLPQGNSYEDDSDSSTPSPLSSMDEPVCQVLEDIREQRMSMCQSLRQYVFVHRVIIEGALALVDAQNKTRLAMPMDVDKNKLEPTIDGSSGMSGTSVSSADDMDISPMVHSQEFKYTQASSVSKPKGTGNFNPIPPPPPPLPPLPSSFQLRPPPIRPPGNHFSNISPTKTGGKRLASPTELTRVDRHGTSSLTKRPSLKHINKSGDSFTNLPSP